MFNSTQKSMIEIFAESAIETLAKKENKTVEFMKSEFLKGGEIADRVMSIVVKTCSMPTADFKALTGI